MSMNSAIKWSVVLGMVLMACIGCWYADYRCSLIPKCLGSIDFEMAEKIHPDIATWRASARPWEFVSFPVTKKLCECLSIKADKYVVATYHRRIKRIEPYSFHAVKGRLIFEDADDKIYIYSYHPRYWPSFQ